MSMCPIRFGKVYVGRLYKLHALLIGVPEEACGVADVLLKIVLHLATAYLV